MKRRITTAAYRDEPMIARQPVRVLLIVAVAALLLLIVSEARAATTVGASPPGKGTLQDCSAVLASPTDLIQVRATEGNPFVVPAPGGVITSWRTVVVSGSMTASLRLFTGNETQVVPVAESASVSATPASSGPFPTRLSVSGGEILGMKAFSPGGEIGCLAGPTLPTGAPYLMAFLPPLALGQPEPVINSLGGVLVSVAANVEPDSDADGFGDETQDAFVAKGPKQKTTRTKATFTLAGAGSFECRVDKKPFAPCASGIKFKKLKERKHTFRVHAITPTGELSPDTPYKWRVVEKKK
jgi:hypothetical protein